MSSAAPTGSVLETYVREHLDDDPQAVLNIALAETERLRLMATAKAQVHINAEGKYEVSSLDGLQRLARMYASSESVPDHFRGDKHIADCAIAINLALRWGWDPLMVLQKCYVVHGRPGLESQLIIARANTCGVFQGRIQYELSGEGDKRQCTATALLAAKHTSDPTKATVTQTISAALAKDMGWWDKKGSLWPKMTDLMLQYRSAAWLVRTIAPEVLMGVYMDDELKEMDEGDPPPATTEKPSLEEMLDSGATMGVDDVLGDPHDDLVGFPTKVVEPPGRDPSVELPPAPQRPLTKPAPEPEHPATDANPTDKSNSIYQDRIVSGYREHIEKAGTDDELDELFNAAKSNRTLAAVSLNRIKSACEDRRKEL